MLFLDEIKDSTRESELYKHIVKIRENLEKMVDVQYAKKGTLTQVLDEIANIDEINMEDTQGLLSVIEDIRNILSRIDYNIDGIKELIEDISGIQDRLDNIIDQNIEDNLLKRDIEYFYILYIEKTNIVEDTNLSYENIIIKAYEFIFLLVSKLNGEKQSKDIIEKLVNSDKLLDLDDKKESQLHFKVVEENGNKENIVTDIEEEKQEEVINVENKESEEFIQDKNEQNGKEKICEEIMVKEENILEESAKKEIKEEKNIKENAKNELKEENIIKENAKNEDSILGDTIGKTSKDKDKDKDIEVKVRDNNVLIISQVQNKVFLPYKVSDLKRKYKEKNNKFKSIQDMISTEYVVPLNKYKNPVISRFKEAYALMRDKEDATFSEALDLALEVTFKSNLNPAVITACNNLSELDQFLDCLEENKLDKFNIFKVEYEGLLSIK